MENTIFEGYPDPVLARIESRDRLRAGALPIHALPVMELVFEDLKLWQVGTLQVSFKGGTPELHRQIAECAAEWSNHANIRFDFGYNETTQTFRTWTPNDNSHIRVGFEDQGYWSFVGTDSTDPLITKPGDITLNLNGFDINLPNDWKGTTLHEFGHAIGFHHEHQSPVSNCDFDWDLLYTYLAKPPNNWSRAKVDHNLRQLPGGGLTYGPHDKHSIMHYSFPAWMFKKKHASTCFTSRNNQLSAEDKRMASEAYPFDRDEFISKTENRKKNLEQILEAMQDAPSLINDQFSRHLAYLQNDNSFEHNFS